MHEKEGQRMWEDNREVKEEQEKQFEKARK